MHAHRISSPPGHGMACTAQQAFSARMASYPLHHSFVMGTAEGMPALSAYLLIMYVHAVLLVGAQACGCSRQRRTRCSAQSVSHFSNACVHIEAEDSSHLHCHVSEWMFGLWRCAGHVIMIMIVM